MIEPQFTFLDTLPVAKEYLCIKQVEREKIYLDDTWVIQFVKLIQDGWVE